MPFDISFGGFINFFLGMVTGVVAFLSLFVFLSFRGKHINLDNIKRPGVEVDEDELRDLVKSKQDKLKRALKYDTESVGKSTFNISYELLEEISRYFFPESKYPMLELSVHELIDLNKYISDRIDELMDIPILKHVKKMRIISVVQMFEKKRKLEESKLMKAAKKARLGKVLKYGGMALNAVNPVYWFRKLVINTSIDAMTRKICIEIIAVVGEETTKVYSKKLFDKDIELELVNQDIEKLLLEGDEDDETN